MSITNLFARAASTKLGSSIIKATAFRDPARHLHDLDGTVYMRRWHLVREGSFASRVLERITGYSSIRLHHIVREDRDRDLHSHPFGYRTFVIGGAYREEYQLPGKGQRVRERTVRKGETSTLDQACFHRIKGVTFGGVWTVFCMTRNTGLWGFRVNGRFIESATYFKRRGWKQPGKDGQ